MSQLADNFTFRSQNPAAPTSEYKAIVSQASTAAPTVTTTITNSTGTTMTWARTSAGLYTLTAGVATFTAGKTFVKMSFGGTATVGIVVVTSTTVLTFTFTDAATPTAADLAGTMFLQVEIYPA